jgi:NAD(P)-dependent dehydrogenase (short-subunit alcohol dehydrogenase family)
MTSMDGARVLVVGASAGIGRALAQHAAADGAAVAAVARRGEKLAELDGCTPIVADIGDADACRRIVEEAVDALGTIDLLVHAVGVGILSHIEHAEADAWASMYAVNVIGPTLVTAAALPHLAPDAIVSFLSSASTLEPHWGMSPYTASKAALESTIRSWRLEHPDRRFQRVVMGTTVPTDFPAQFDPDLLTVALDRWARSGLSGGLMNADQVGRHLADTYAVLLAHPEIDVPDITYDGRGNPWE